MAEKTEGCFAAFFFDNKVGMLFFFGIVSL